jgi:hypothetical protein
MPAPASTDRFYSGLPIFRDFTHVMDPELFRPLPDDWVVGTADIVQSTKAIAENRYKAVNMAGAAVIVAVTNAMAGRDFPFVFGGDGASFALPPEQETIGREALASVAAWVRDELALEMRTAVVPLAAVRASGFDVRVARFAPSPNVSYAMFTGGGLAWAEARMKEGEFAIKPGAQGARPDLTGLSCRFDEIKAERGVILSLIVVPGRKGDAPSFDALVVRILELAESGAEAGRPVPEAGPPPRWPPAGFDLEARASPLHARSRIAARLWVGARTLAAHMIFRAGRRVGGFDPARYQHQLVENTDFRKFDDGLRMTLDCTPELADRIEALLAAAEAAGTARAGTHRQEAALMTCFVPSATRSDHVHFVDGAMGGYAAAARALKLAP